MSKKLVLLTKTFPYAAGEPFLENEISYLAKAYDEILIIATSLPSHATVTRKLPANVHSVGIMRSRVSLAIAPRFLSLLPFAAIYKMCDETDRAYIRSGIKRRGFYSYYVAKSLAIYRKAQPIVRNFLDGNGHTVLFYSFWFFDISLVAVLLRDFFGKDNDATAITRGHRYDIYQNKNSLGYLPMRSWTLKRIDAVYPCSQDGTEWLQHQFPQYSARVATAYLGTNDYGLSTQSEDGVLRIVSCSSMISVKRISLIIEALALLDNQNVKVAWTHYGSGKLMDVLKKQAEEILTASVQYTFAGYLDNGKIMQKYLEQPVDIFINTSKSEGLPVSIMEAISFGIPVIATNVGGTHEIVQNEETGYLLDADPTPAQIAEAIMRYDRLAPREKAALRQRTRENWASTFRADLTYKRFIAQLDKIQKKTLD